jgi:hypothetical protein
MTYVRTAIAALRLFPCALGQGALGLGALGRGTPGVGALGEGTSGVGTAVGVLAGATLWAVAVVGCVPPGNAVPSDAGAPTAQATTRPAMTAPAATPQPTDVMKAPFEDDFEHGVVAPVAVAAGVEAGGPGVPPMAAAAASDASELLPSADWIATAPGIWHIEAGRLCGEHARNHGLWLKRVLPPNARIEFDAVSQSPDGDLKAEYWGDGRSFATSLSYTNATSYLTIFGGWHNTFHVLARINEHATDRQEITVDKNSDDPREKPVMAGQIYRFKVERTDAKTVRWWVDGNEMLTYPDVAPLVGVGHDHFGFNDWDVKVCFDNVRVTPLP